MNEQLMRAVICTATFFELSGDDIIDPDAALQQMESLSKILRDLSPTEKQKFIDFTQKYALEEEANGASVERLDFIKSISDSLGLLDKE